MAREKIAPRLRKAGRGIALRARGRERARKGSLGDSGLAEAAGVAEELAGAAGVAGSRSRWSGRSGDGRPMPEANCCVAGEAVVFGAGASRCFTYFVLENTNSASMLCLAVSTVSSKVSQRKCTLDKLLLWSGPLRSERQRYFPSHRCRKLLRALRFSAAASAPQVSARHRRSRGSLAESG